MADGTKIEWTDATWQIVTGCSIESPGCTNCYAMKLAGTRLRNHPSRIGLTRPSAAGPVWTGEVRFNEQWLDQPLQWTRPRMIFVAAHGDLFHSAVPYDVLDKVFAVMALAGRHTFQVLTKRTTNALGYLRGLRTVDGKKRLEAAARSIGWTFKHEDMLLLHFPLRNVWIGTSVEDQRYADVRRESLRGIADMGWLTWVSYEPALGPVDWTGWEFIRWMVSGGESGAGARPAHPQWHRDTRDWCAEHGIAFLFKQHGDWAPPASRDDLRFLGDMMRAGKAVHLYGRGREEDGCFRKGDEHVLHVGKKAAGRLLDGVEHNGFPGSPAP